MLEEEAVLELVITARASGRIMQFVTIAVPLKSERSRVRLAAHVSCRAR